MMNDTNDQDIQQETESKTAAAPEYGSTEEIVESEQKKGSNELLSMLIENNGVLNEIKDLIETRLEYDAVKEKAFDKKLMAFKHELESGNRIPEHENQYWKYFEVKTMPKQGTKVYVKEEAVLQAKKYFGFFCLLTNETMDAVTALETYRNKDLVEKAFGNLKERLNLRRTFVSSEQSLDGKLFVEFVALIYLSYIKKQMQLSGLFKKYTLQGALDKLDVIECFEVPGQKLRVGEILEKQNEIYRCLGVEPPSSL